MLKEDIGINAWTVWLLLSRNGSLTIKEICEMTDCNDSLVFLTLGWLLKDNIVCFLIEDDNTLYVQLTSSQTGTYN